MRKINKILVANRGEIAIRIFRACTELNIETVAIYSTEDSGAYHRFKADEAYLIGEGKSPIDAYLDIEGILSLAKRIGADAIHPGYGFLSENIAFVKRCEEEGIQFIGPRSEQLHIFGDKVRARTTALEAGLPVIPGTDGPIHSVEEARAFGNEHGYPIIIKASLGGGGRGMRVVHEESELEESYERAKSEARAAFGNDEVYVEKLIEKPKHIEIQILGDAHGHVIHLYDRDCSVQRRHQKVIEVAPSISLPEKLRSELCEAAVQLMKFVNYENAGTVEFLVTEDDFYFIEVNPRVQVEHTITEMITGIDIVQSQIKIAENYSLHDETLNIPAQEDIQMNGYAIQTRVTTEDPLNDFMPDAGKIMVYRSGGGFGVRLDAGNGFQGAVISPHYDSLLVKVSTWGLSFDQAAQKMIRNLKELRIRGLKTNVPFLQNVVLHDKFTSGSYDTTFIDETPELFIFPKRRNRGTKLLTYIGETTINGFNGNKKSKPILSSPTIPIYEKKSLKGTKQILDAHGPSGVSEWVKEQQEVLLTDTTFRDAHQSLLATRVRTKDLLKIAEPTSQLLPDLFSVEMWGGATFDVAYRFLHEDPWERLIQMREKMPNILLQMLLRGSNAVGYKNYPDNVNIEFIKKSADAGVDLFRIFDSLNWLEGMTLAIDEVRANNKIAEASICYTGNLLDRGQNKYDLSYYKNLAIELEKAGAHILGIKDMAGLLKPEAAYQLISTLKDTVQIPIHLHTHDTSGNGIFTYARAIEAGVDIVDVAASALAGSTSQPSAQTLYHALEGTTRQPNVNIDAYEQLSKYWEGVRNYYAPFESGLRAPHTEIYQHEMPGGQYSNLQQQAQGVGLGDRFDEVKEMFHHVNMMFGDIVKVTPSSKIVGDLALFMVQNDLTEEDIYEQGESIDFPQSVIEFAQGYIGQPYQGFPKRLQEIILKGRKSITERPGKSLKPICFTTLEKKLFKQLERQVTPFDLISYTLYPEVYIDYQHVFETYGDLSVLDTLTFFHGMRLGEEIEVEIEQGKTLFVKLISISEPQADGRRVVYFELNGQSREVLIEDHSVQSSVAIKEQAEKGNSKHIGATMPGTVLDVLCKEGDTVEKGDHLLITEAMKMETTVQAPYAGTIKKIYAKTNEQISTNDLLIEFE